MKRSSSSRPIKQVEQRNYIIEAEVVPGLEQLAAREIQERHGATAQLLSAHEQRLGGVLFRYRGDLKQLMNLRVAQAVYIVDWFDIPRPKALLGNTEFRVITDTIRTMMDIAPREYSSFHISAAGSDSSVMKRFAQAIAQATGLIAGDETGDLWLRIRRGPAQHGWELLTRIGNRPLATRRWRVCNYEGALNATVSYAMTLLSRPNAQDSVVNLGCGSGSLLIERSMWGEAKQLIGIDRDAYAIGCAQQNLAAAERDALLLEADIADTPIKSASIDVILSDLPFGKLSGSHTENKRLYPAMLEEAARIARAGARMVVITHELRLMQASLSQFGHSWQLRRDIPITLRGLHPHIYLLKRL